MPIHGDVRAGKGHSFSDITALPDGEVGFVWLDKTYVKGAGRSVKYLYTLPNGILSNEIIINPSAIFFSFILVKFLTQLVNLYAKISLMKNVLNICVGLY